MVIITISSCIFASAETLAQAFFISHKKCLATSYSSPRPRNLRQDVVRSRPLWATLLTTSKLAYRLSGRGVPSALEGLTSVFGMGTGITPPLWSPGKIFIYVNG
jgi:hypothetical protein